MNIQVELGGKYVHMYSKSKGFNIDKNHLVEESTIHGNSLRHQKGSPLGYKISAFTPIMTFRTVLLKDLYHFTQRKFKHYWQVILRTKLKFNIQVRWTTLSSNICIRETYSNLY